MEYSYLLDKCCKKFYGLDNYTLKGNYLGVQTIPPNNACVRPVYANEFQYGLISLHKLLRYVAYLIVYKGYEFV